MPKYDANCSNTNYYSNFVRRYHMKYFDRIGDFFFKKKLLDTLLLFLISTNYGRVGISNLIIILGVTALTLLNYVVSLIIL